MKEGNEIHQCILGFACLLFFVLEEKEIYLFLLSFAIRQNNKNEGGVGEEGNAQRKDTNKKNINSDTVQCSNSQHLFLFKPICIFHVLNRGGDEY